MLHSSLSSHRIPPAGQLRAFVIVATGLACLGFLPVARAQEPAKTPSLPVDASETQPSIVTTDEPPKADDPTSKDIINLLDGEFEKQWKVYSAEPSPSVWRIVRETPEAEPLLVCTGEIKGFLATIDRYDDFELTIEWKYPKDANGNSGILVYTQDEERIWPTSVQIQLHQPKAGSIFPSGDAMTDNTRDVDLNLARPVDTWNEGRVISRQGRLSVEINGKKAGEVTGARPAAGRIALQSEGSEVHFRNLKLRKLPPEPAAPSPAPETK